RQVHQCAVHHQARAAAAGGPARRDLGIRHVHRRAGPRGRGGQRPDAGRLRARAHHRAAGHGRHGLSCARQRDRTGRPAPARRAAETDAAHPPGHARHDVRVGRRRHGLDHGRLCAAVPVLVQRRHAGRRAPGLSQDRGADDHQPPARQRAHGTGHGVFRRPAALARGGPGLRSGLCGAHGARPQPAAGQRGRFFMERHLRHLLLGGSEGGPVRHPHDAVHGPAHSLPLGDARGRVPVRGGLSRQARRTER
ncbi:conserved hypothetical protein, partial [Ricinus communis]